MGYATNGLAVSLAVITTATVLMSFAVYKAPELIRTSRYARLVPHFTGENMEADRG